MKKYRLCAVVFLLLAALLVCACSQTTPQEPTANPTNAPEPVSEPTTETPPEPSTAPPATDPAVQLTAPENPILQPQSSATLLPFLMMREVDGLEEAYRLTWNISNGTVSEPELYFRQHISDNSASGIHRWSGGAAFSGLEAPLCAGGVSYYPSSAVLSFGRCFVLGDEPQFYLDNGDGTDTPISYPTAPLPEPYDNTSTTPLYAGVDGDNAIVAFCSYDGDMPDLGSILYSVYPVDAPEAAQWQSASIPEGVDAMNIFVNPSAVYADGLLCIASWEHLVLLDTETGMTSLLEDLEKIYALHPDAMTVDTTTDFYNPSPSVTLVGCQQGTVIARIELFEADHENEWVYFAAIRNGRLVSAMETGEVLAFFDAEMNALPTSSLTLPGSSGLHIFARDD